MLELTHIGSNKIKTINPHENFVTCSTFSLENDRPNGRVLLGVWNGVPIVTRVQPKAIKSSVPKPSCTFAVTVVTTLSYIDGV